MLALSQTIDPAALRAFLAGAAGGLAVSAAAATTYFSLSAESQAFGHTLIADGHPHEVALTYDDGPNDRCTPPLLDILARHNVRATFFMIGRFVLQQPALAREVLAAGHLIGNHTMTHPWLAWQSSTRIRQELLDCNHALEDTLGIPIHYFRPPHGARRPAVLRIAADLGLTTVQWNAIGKDWLPITPDRIVSNLNLAKKRNRGTNIVLHDGSHTAMSADRTATLAATELLLARFAQNGNRTVTVDAWK